MSENTEEIKPKIPVWAMWVTGGWLILSVVGLFIFPQYNTNKLSLGDIGGYIAGVFAPIAWLWFYLSYRVQSEELQLQRKELQNSVQAQQGSEIALRQQAETLRIQTNTLTEQLRISSDQWNSYLEEKKKSKPKFILESIELTSYIPVNQSLTRESINEQELSQIQTLAYHGFRTDSIVVRLEMDLTIRNIAADCKVKNVKLQYPNENKIAYAYFSLDNNPNPEKFVFKLFFTPFHKKFVEEKDIEGLQSENVFHGNILEIYYSYKDTSDADTYRIIYDETYHSYSLELTYLTDC